MANGNYAKLESATVGDTVFVTPTGGWYYKAEIIGDFDAYGHNPEWKTYKVKVTSETGFEFTDYFREVYREVA